MSFATAFPTDSRKINNLVLAVDQEVGGSNPPSCTSKINRLGKAWRNGGKTRGGKIIRFPESDESDSFCYVLKHITE